MYCPACQTANPPGSDACGHCGTPLARLDEPAPHDRVERGLMADPVSALGPRDPVTVPLDADLGAAVRAMIAGGIGAVLVVHPDGTLAGILTERDFLSKVADRPGFAALPARDFMTPDPETVGPADRIAVALGRMDGGGYRHLPVVDGGRPVGVVSVRDILRYVTRLCQAG